MREKVLKFLVIIAFAFALAGLTLTSLALIQSARIFLIITMLVIIGWLTQHFEEDLKEIVLTNELIIILLMLISRLSAVIIAGEWAYLDPLNILVSFIMYTIVTNFTSVFIKYVVPYISGE